MKNFTYLLLVFLCMSFNPAKAWMPDVQVYAGIPQGTYSVIADNNSILYAGIPDTTVNSGYGLAFYSSSNGGITWNLLPISAAPSLTVKKSKMLLTGLNKVLCVWLADSTVYVTDLSTGISTPFTTLPAEDFDAITSTTGNIIYLFVDDKSDNDLRRYTSSDAGLTWNTGALVTANGSRPKVYMTGTRVILNYYGALSSDTISSVIRAANYNETTAGTLATSGAFQDVLPANGFPHPYFKSVVISGKVWFFYLEGSSNRILKYKVSNNNGTGYGSSLTLAGNASENIFSFDIIHYNGITGNGIDIVYYRDSLQSGPPTAQTDKLIHLRANALAPSVFTVAESFNEGITDMINGNFFPSLVRLGSTATHPGCLWIQTDSTALSSLYYDGIGIFTGIAESAFDADISVYPNPFSSEININFPESVSANIKLLDINGKLIVAKKLINQQYTQLQIQDLTDGIYNLNIETVKGIFTRKIIRIQN